MSDFFEYLPTKKQSERLGSREKDKELLYVPMGFAEAVCATDKTPKIGTSSLASCAGICIYDPERKVGAVAHVFFNEKTVRTWTTYLKDSLGRNIPETGKMHYEVVNDPYWFKQFEVMMYQVIYKANEKGGQKYEFHGFNISEGARTKDQNQELFAFAESVVKKLYDSQVFIGDPDWKLWPGFILDTRTGLILPYY